MRLRYPGTCSCGRDLPAGTRAGWDRVQKIVICQDCLTGPAQPAFTTDALAHPGTQHPSGPATLGPDPGPATPAPQSPQLEQAGASLTREYQRRVAGRQDQIRARDPHIGGLILALTDDPHSTKAFRSGAAGEQRAAKQITDRCGQRVLFLLNRALGMGRYGGDDLTATVSLAQKVVHVIESVGGWTGQRVAVEVDVLLSDCEAAQADPAPLWG